MPFNKATGSSRLPAQRVNSPTSESGGYTNANDRPQRPNISTNDEPDEKQKGFISSHFGNPEQIHVYGAGNDYESEEQVKEEEKAAAGQFIWYFGALALFLFVCYILFGLRR